MLGKCQFPVEFAIKAHIAEEWFRVEMTRGRKSLSPDEVSALVHELQVHQLELEAQNEELRNARSALIAQQIEEIHRLQFAKNSSVMLLIDPRDGRIIDANAAAQAFYGYSRDKLLAMSITEINTLSTTEAQVIMDSVSEENGSHFELQHRLADGSIREVSVSVSRIQSAGQPVLHSIIHDITTRKKAERDQLEHIATYRDILATTLDGFWLIDTQGNILDVNDSYIRQSGYTRQELLGMRPYDLDINESAVDTADHIQRVIDDGQAMFETIHRRKDGSTWHVEVSVGVSNRAGGKLVAFFRDITLRKKVSEQITRSLQEKEVLLKEVHHRVKNNMQLVHSVLSLQAKRVTDPRTRHMFDQSLNRVYSMALIHERLYQSKDLTRIDFKGYLQTLVDAISISYRLPNVTCVVAMEPFFLDVNVGIPCGLIANELVSNCLKHAFPDGRKGTITVGIHKNSQGENVLTVEDNGIGCPPTAAPGNTTPLGLQIVNGLTAQIHGTIQRTIGGGTKFRITFPETSNNHGVWYEQAAN